MVKCDWCGKETSGECGWFVYENGNERFAHICVGFQNMGRHKGNPVFENIFAWRIWKIKHPTLAKRIVKPKLQYSQGGGGDKS